MAAERASASSVLRVSGLRRDFGDLTAVDGFNLDLAAGECVSLIGHNGSGKTTALRVAAGQLVPTSGTVTVSGADVHDRRRGHVARARLAFVPDSPVLYDDLTVGEHLELVGLAHGVREDLDGRITMLLERLGLTARRDFLPRQLSRGMRQKTQIACAFVRPFEVLLLDEPVVGLDPPTRNRHCGRCSSRPSEVGPEWCSVRTSSSSRPTWPIAGWCWTPVASWTMALTIGWRMAPK
jgi:ABC-2 type transport system ATP-binding protein